MLGWVLRLPRRAPNLSGDPTIIPDSRSPCTMWPCLRVCVYECQVCVYLSSPLQCCSQQSVIAQSSEALMLCLYYQLNLLRVLSGVHKLYKHTSYTLLHKQISGLIQRLQQSIRNIGGYRCLYFKKFMMIFDEYPTLIWNGFQKPNLKVVKCFQY